MPPKSSTISISTEAFDEFQVAMKAAGLDTMPDQLVIKRDTNITQPIDFRLATIRRDCLISAVNANPGNWQDTAASMFDFVTGKEVEKPFEYIEPSPQSMANALAKQKTGGWK